MGSHDQLPRTDLEPEVRLHKVSFHHSEPGGSQDTPCQQGTPPSISAVHAPAPEPCNAKHDATDRWLSGGSAAQHALDATVWAGWRHAAAPVHEAASQRL